MCLDLIFPNAKIHTECVDTVVPVSFTVLYFLICRLSFLFVLFSDEQIVRIVLKILEPLYPQLQDLNESFDKRTETSNSDKSDKNSTEIDKNVCQPDRNNSANGIASSLDTNKRTQTAIERYELIEKEELTLLLTFVQSFISDFLSKFAGVSMLD